MPQWEEERHHSFVPSIAKMYGVNAAIILENIRYWVLFNESNGTNEHDGYTWTYNSMEAFQKQYEYMSLWQIRNAIGKLKEEGLILTGNYNTESFNRTMWYTLTDKGRSLFQVIRRSKEKNLTFDNVKTTNASEEYSKSSITDINITDINIGECGFCKNTQIDTYGFSDPLRQAIENWIAYKKEKRQSYRETGLKQLLTKIKKEAEKHGDEAVIEVIESSMSSNYQGIVWDRIKDRKKSGSAYIDAINNRYDVVDKWLKKSGES